MKIVSKRTLRTEDEGRVDDLLRRQLHQEPDPDRFYMDWYYFIEGPINLGIPLQALLISPEASEELKVALHWLDGRYIITRGR